MKTPKSFEEGASRLEAILDKIRDEETPLSDAVKLYAEAAELMAYCNDALNHAKLQIEEIDAKMQMSETPEVDPDDADGV